MNHNTNMHKVAVGFNDHSYNEFKTMTNVNYYYNIKGYNEFKFNTNIFMIR